tara:strand:- start:315 stop:854 length:540 start_codon:yes stop_codon:yes gene_type:complete
MKIYEPREDSFLLQKHVRKLVKKDHNVLDIGTGSAIQAITAKKITDNVLAVDINPKAIKLAKEKGLNAKISNLFSNINNKQKFDVIIFNPPYLPEDKREKFEERLALSGGKYGHEILKRFFSQAKDYLNAKGKILVVFSSLTGDIINIIKSLGYTLKKLDEQSFFFEKIQVYLITPKSL